MVIVGTNLAIKVLLLKKNFPIDLKDPEREEDPQFLFNNITYSDGQTEQALTGIFFDVFRTGTPLLYVKVSYFTKWIKEIIDAKYT